MKFRSIAFLCMVMAFGGPESRLAFAQSEEGGESEGGPPAPGSPVSILIQVDYALQPFVSSFPLSSGAFAIAGTDILFVADMRGISPPTNETFLWTTKLNGQYHNSGWVDIGPGSKWLIKVPIQDESPHTLEMTVVDTNTNTIYAFGSATEAVTGVSRTIPEMVDLLPYTSTMIKNAARDKAKADIRTRLIAAFPENQYNALRATHPLWNDYAPSIEQMADAAADRIVGDVLEAIAAYRCSGAGGKILFGVGSPARGAVEDAFADFTEAVKNTVDRVMAPITNAAQQVDSLVSIQLEFEWVNANTLMTAAADEIFGQGDFDAVLDLLTKPKLTTLSVGLPFEYGFEDLDGGLFGSFTLYASLQPSGGYVYGGRADLKVRVENNDVRADAGLFGEVTKPEGGDVTAGVSAAVDFHFR